MKDHTAPELGAQPTTIASAEDFDRLLERSHRGPVLLFKHDPWCGISHTAWEEVQEIDFPMAVIDVAAHHDLGQLAAARTAVRHQSPQIILLRDGRPLWSASHFAITEPAVRRAIQVASAER